MWPSIEVMKEVLSGHEEEDPKRESEREGGVALHACSHAPSCVAMRRWLGPPTLSLFSLSLQFSLSILILVSINSHLCIYLRERRVKENGEKH